MGLGGASVAVVDGVTVAGGGVTCVELCSGAADGGGICGMGVTGTGKVLPEELVTAARGNCNTRVWPPLENVTLRP